MTFNYIEEALNKQTEQDFKKSSVYKIAKENNVDSAVLEGNQPDENAGLIKFEELDQHDKTVYLRDVVDFVQQLPKDTMIGLGKGATNAAHILNNLTNVLGINPDDSYEFIQEKLSKQKQALMNMEEESPLINKLISMLPQGTMYTVPIYNKLKAAGIPNSYAFPISAAIGSTLGFDKTETFFVDSKLMQATKEAMGIPPDSSYEEVYDRIVQTAEYGVSGAIMERLFKGVMAAKKLDAVQGQQGSVAVGSGAGSGAVIDAVTPNTQNVTESEEKKTLNFDEQSQISSPMPDDSEMASAGLGPVFKSILKETAKNLPKKGSGNQILGQLQNTPGVKSTEIKWTGLDDFLKNKKKVTKEEIANYLEANQINVSEVQFPRKGKDFGMYNDMLNSIETRKQDFIDANKDIINQRGGIDFDNFSLRTKERPQGSAQSETITFAGLDINPVGKLIRSFDDPNTFDVDVNAIKKQYKADDSSVEFYIVEDLNNQRTIAISKDEYIANLNTDRYELEFVNQMDNFQLEKYALEHTSRSLRSLRSQQQGTTRYDQYTEPSGEDYKELIFKYKQKGDLGGDKPIPVETGVTRYDTIDNLGIDESPHFREPGEIAHVRFKTRYGEGLNDGKKILSVEEMQSDLVQAVKQANESAEEIGEVGIADFPFKNNWYELVLKRLIRYGSDNNFDAIAIPKAKTVKDRYNLAYYVDELQIGSYDPKRREIGIEGYEFGDTRKILTISDLFTFEDAEKRFGTELFNRIIKKADTLKQADYDNGNNIIKFNKQLSFGGEGKDRLYDKTIPSFLKKYGKKWNAKVYDDEIYTGDALPVESNNSIPVTIIEITPEMKKSVQQDSQALFNIFGLGAGAAVGSKAILEDKGNNTISN